MQNNEFCNSVVDIKNIYSKLTTNSPRIIENLISILSNFGVSSPVVDTIKIHLKIISINTNDYENLLQKIFVVVCS